MDDCFVKLREKYKPEEVSDQEIRDFLKLRDKIKETQGLEGILNADSVAEDIETKSLAQVRARKMTLARTNQVKRAIIADIPDLNTPKGAAKVHDRAVSLFTGGSKGFEGSNDSIATVTAAYERRMGGKFKNVIEEQGLDAVAHDNDFSLMLRKELVKPGSVSDPRIVKVAEETRGIFKYITSEMRRLGVDMGEIENYAGWQAWNKKKITAVDEKQWMADMLRTLDHEKTFGPNMTMEDKLKRLSDAREHILMGEGGGKGRDFAKSRSLHFADGEGTHEMLTKYGVFPSAAESTLSQIRLASQRLGLMHKLGPEYERGFNTIKSYVEKNFPGPERAEIAVGENGKPLTGLAGIEARAKALKTDISNLPTAIARGAVPLDHLYSDALGESYGGQSLKALFGQSHRTLVQLQNLGGAAISAVFNDFPSTAAMVRSFDGQGFLGSEVVKLFDQYQRLIRNPQELKQTSALLGVWADDMVGGAMSVRGELSTGQPSGVLANSARWMYKWTGLTAHDHAIHAAGAKMIGARLATHMEKSFAELPEQLQYTLKRYGLKEGHWDAMRQAHVTFPDGVTSLVPEKLFELPNSAFAKGVTAGDVYNKFASALIEATDLATLKGDAYSRTFLYQGTSDDTLVGQMMRYMAQFKSAPIQALRVMNRIGSAAPGSTDWGSIGTTATFMTAAGLLTYYSKELVKGHTPPNPFAAKTEQERNAIIADTLKEALIRGGAAGILGDYVAADYDKSYRSFITDLAGPAAGDVNKFFKIGYGSMKAEWSKGQFFQNPKEAATFLQRQIPFNNVWWAKAAAEHLMLNAFQEHVTPGYTYRLDQRLEKNGQQRIFPSAGVDNRNTLLGGE